MTDNFKSTRKPEKFQELEFRCGEVVPGNMSQKRNQMQYTLQKEVLSVAPRVEMYSNVSAHSTSKEELEIFSRQILVQVQSLPDHYPLHS